MITIFATDLISNVKKYDVVVFGMGINNAFNSGLLYEIALNFPKVKESENENSPYGDKRKYGTIYSTEADGIVFCACYMNDGGYNRNKGEEDCVKYDMLEKCLRRVAEKYAGKKICAPIIGSSFYDGKGEKKKIMSIFARAFANADIDLYDYEQRDFRLYIFRKIAEARAEYKSGKLTKEQYTLKKRQLCWQRDNGIFKEMPENYEPKTNRDLIRVKKIDLN